ncbi:metallophosphoesterase [Phycicoccus elongatus]|uniref:metallophosphoesterase n=1 Tax=Phycicoccus elongatus TaxID=101689 RepID=UPI003783D4E1
MPNWFFLLVPVAVLLGALGLLTHRLIHAPRWRSRRARLAALVGMVVLTGLSFLQFGAGPTFLSPAQARPLVWIGATWLATAHYLLLGALVMAVLSLVLGWGNRERKTRVNRIGAALVVVAALATTAYGVVKAADPTVTPMTFRSPALPAAFDGTKVALITDIHAGAVRSAATVQRIVDRTNAAEPDLVLIAGDLIDGPVDRYAAELAPLRGLRASLGVYAVTGNHEMYSGTISGWEDDWKTLGIQVVSNAVTTVTSGGDSMAIGGVHDWSGTGEFAPDYDAAVEGVAASTFQIVLAHQPRAASRLAGRGVDLQVSGHTHGGQLWPFRALVLLQQPMVDGQAVIDGVPVITSRGAGAWGPSVRVGADPEIPVLTMTRG